MADTDMLGPPMNPQHWYSKKYGPLPGWAWAAGGLAIVGYIWYRNREANAAAAANSADQFGDSPTDTTAGAEGYSEGYGAGYDTGYGSGIGSSGSGGNPAPVGKIPPGYEYCRDLKNPDGVAAHVCGFGHWFQPKGQKKWYWTPGPAPTHPNKPGRVVSATGESGYYPPKNATPAT